MYTRPRIRRRDAWTLVEMMLAVSIFFIAGLAVGSLFLFGVKSSAALVNYAELDQQNREVIDRVTREIRQARQVQSYTLNPKSLTFLDGDNVPVTYSFNQNRILRTRSGVTEMLLTNCNVLDFQLYQRNPSNGVPWSIYLANTNLQKSVKVVQLSWKSKKTLGGTTLINSENIQTARIVIRKQQD
jgi:type II secretory pathway pseudopilin PulG